jgi:hypothetical protein
MTICGHDRNRATGNNVKDERRQRKEIQRREHPTCLPGKIAPESAEGVTFQPLGLFLPAHLYIDISVCIYMNRKNKKKK